MPKPTLSAPVLNATCDTCKKTITKLSDCVRITYPKTTHEERYCIACYFRKKIN